MTRNEPSFRAALVQMCSASTFEPNRLILECAIEQAAENGAAYIQTPELSPVMELSTKKLFAQIESEEKNKALSRICALAKKFSIWLHLGSMAVALPDGKIANRSYLITPKGAIAARYDKLHMFDVTMPDGRAFQESKYFRPGMTAIVADMPWGNLGMTICYDLRFPALYRALAQAGAHVIAVPSAFTRETGLAHWETLLRARAIETGCYILAAAQCGDHEDGRKSYGHAMAISPWGEIIAQAGEEPTVIYANIDLAQVQKVRARIPSLQHDCVLNVAETGNT